MKTQDIQEFEIGQHCFGNVLRINGKDYDEFTKEEILEFINDFLKNDINSDVLMEEIFTNILEHLQYDCVEDGNRVCEQCGDDNNYSKYIKP